MKFSFLIYQVILINFALAPVTFAQENNLESKKTSIKKTSEIPYLNEIEKPYRSAELLTQTPIPSKKPQTTGNPEPNSTTNESKPTVENEGAIIIDVTGKKDDLPQSTPTYVIEKEEIQKQGATSVSDVLKKLPGFAINDSGHGADIHTGTYYRGASINQSVFLINGRSINSNVNTYHGATDLNSIPVEAIERVELYSGAASTLYGSSAFGGVVNIITKEGSTVPRFNATAEFGDLNFNNQQLSYAGSTGSLRYNFSFERSFLDNRYRVPVGAANRDARGYFFNADTANSTYFGHLAFDVDNRNTLSLDVTTLSSRKGLIYFGFPLQRDRLDHDGLNIGFAWKTRLSNDNSSVVTTTLGYNQDYFNTYGPSSQFYRTGTLDTQLYTARIDHAWQLTPNYKLRWGLDLQNTDLTGDVLSTVPNRVALNENENESLLNTALFAVNTLNITDKLQVDLGLRQSFDSKFGNYFNPSVGFKYDISPALAVRGSWAGGQRNPGLDQLYVYDTVHGWLPNRDLKPETGSSWTAGVDVKLLENLIGQFTYFGSSLDDRLGVVEGKWANIGLVDTNGLEAALRWNIGSGWSTFVNYTYTDAKIQTGPEKGLQLGLIPYSVASAGIGYEIAGWQANLYATYYGGARRAIYTRVGETATDFSPSFFNLDFSARVPVTKNLGLTVYLENLLDEQYERVNRIYSPGFTFRLGLTANI
ncbi:TonB-dependent receptor plug domain-containing protein [Brasilonema octagenarum]|uniref:TonB-dependent receptor n=1 Tax=Brasilonema octagenarum UFV-OR1 TaxID=417115 RepID=A0ABX1M014_9CYAN|nr:TonB-dependent receptor [Brasilonema octagenarum]NMF61817.1 TonB-dependent receptor [Brasilonema octagenarum UFV-OR1]